MKKMTVDEFAEWAASVVQCLPRGVKPTFAANLRRNQNFLRELLRTVFVDNKEAEKLLANLTRSNPLPAKPKG